MRNQAYQKDLNTNPKRFQSHKNMIVIGLVLLFFAHTAHAKTSWVGDDFPLKPYFRAFPSLKKTQTKSVLNQWRRGNIQQAIKQYTNAIQNQPKETREKALLQLAYQLDSFSDTKRAQAIYIQLTKAKRYQVALAAKLFLARGYFKQFQYKKALQVLQNWSTTRPKNKQMRQYWIAGWLLHGVLAIRRKHYTEAHKSFQILIKKRTIVADIAAYFSLRRLSKKKQYRQLLIDSKKFIRQYKHSRFRTKVKLMRAKAFEKRNQIKQALVMYRRMAQRQNKGSAWLGMIRCLLKQKRYKQTHRILIRLIRKSPGRWTAQSAYRTLQRRFPKKQSPTTRYSIAYHLFRRGALKQAAKRLRQLLHSKQINQHIRHKALYLHGRVMFRLKQYRPARRSLLHYLQHAPRGRYRLAAKLLRIRAQYRMRKDLPTVKEYERFARRYRKSKLGQKALWWAAQLYFEHDKTKYATKLFDLFYKRYPRSRRRAEARIKIALIAYKQKRYARTIKRLHPLTKWGGRTAARALFWTGKAYEKQHKKTLAHQYFKKISRFSDSYYAACAKIRTEKRKLLASQPLSLYSLLPNQQEEARHRKQIAQWMRTQYPKKNVEDLVKKCKRKRAYRRAYLFALAGQDASLRAEMRQLQRQASHPFDLYLLARAWKAFGDPNRTLYTASRFRRKIPRSKRKKLPFRALLRLLYPIPFPAAYASNSKRYHIPALLLVGLTRQESLFNPTIVSHAGARGIAQIMPKEARKMAKRWHIRGFRIQHLFRPQLNLRMGFHHFRAYLNRHNQNIPLTLAAYNAGPGALKRWIKKDPSLPKQDLEAFIEYGIGYRETRLYVRYCLRWYNLYRFAFASHHK